MLVRQQSKKIKYSAHEAITLGDLDTLKCYSKLELKDDEDSIYGSTLLFYAIEHNQIKILKYLLEEVGIEAKPHTKDGTLIHYAIELGEFEIVKYLASSAAKHLINSCHPKNQYTPLDYAVINNEIEIAAYLIEEAKAQIVHSEQIPSLLHLAVHSENMDMIKYLINSPAKSILKNYYHTFYYQKDKDKNKFSCPPPLHLAVEKENLNIVKYLIEDAKINPDETDKNNLCPLEFLILFAEINEKSLNIARYLIPKTKLRYGNTPLHWAAEEDKLEIVTLLFNEFKPDIQAKNIWGLSPLDRAGVRVKKYLESKKIPVPMGNNEYKLPEFHYYPHTSRRKSWCEYDKKAYEKDSLLGKGVCGEVYSFLATKSYFCWRSREDIKKPDKIAIKTIPPFKSVKPLNLRKEAEIYHSIYRIGSHDHSPPTNTTYIAMPVISGVSADTIKITSLKAFIKLSKALVKALNDLHTQHNLVHADLNLGNFMVKMNSLGNYIAKMIDFGYSLKIGQLLPQHLFLNRFATPHYAPEVDTPIQASPTQDIYSLGYLLFHLYHRARLPISQRPEYLLRMMDNDPKKRPSLVEIQNALDADLLKHMFKSAISEHSATFFCEQKLSTPSSEEKRDSFFDAHRSPSL